jgi:hypothetical protein
MFILFFNQKNPGSRRRQGDERHRKQARQGSKEYAVARVKEYEEKGYIEGYPECYVIILSFYVICLHAEL